MTVRADETAHCLFLFFCFWLTGYPNPDKGGSLWMHTIIRKPGAVRQVSPLGVEPPTMGSKFMSWATMPPVQVVRMNHLAYLYLT